MRTTQQTVTHGKRVWRGLQSRHGLFLSAVAGSLAFFLVPEDWRLATRLLTGWDVTALLFIAMVMVSTFHADVTHCRRRAAFYDAGDFAILLITILGAVASFVAIFIELAQLKSGSYPLLRLLLTGVTVGLSWAFTHVGFALHYASLYYRQVEGKDAGGLDFPGGREPDYSDFMYYSFVLACAAATADVNTTSRSMRQVTMIQGIIAFVFNTAVLALTINIGASLVSGN
jgi:uncharacterized membrane protein